jgi:hypothetical protein
LTRIQVRDDLARRRIKMNCKFWQHIVGWAPGSKVSRKALQLQSVYILEVLMANDLYSRPGTEIGRKEAVFREPVD